jgi:type I restriction enzyme S subunit
MDAKQFLAEFGHIVNAPGGIFSIKKIILGLAYRGELVGLFLDAMADFDISDSLRMEKQNEERLKKKDRKLLKVKAAGLPFPLPKGWQWQYLVNIGYILNGNSISKDDREFTYSKIEEGYPFISTKDVSFDR